ncbi:MAG: hypothetical protein JWO46_2071 [Nocardioidaceae bacterium]|nr:hypothetical protein [Nocardioidaceae bacterium]
MTPLQRIAIGMVVVAIPADFGSECHAYDALPDPIGWLVVLSGVWALGRTLDVDWAKWFGVLALVVSVPLWLPSVNQLLVPACNPGHVQDSLRWGLSLPPFVFGFALSRTIGRNAQWQSPRDSFAAGRFGVLTWAFAACAVLPAVGYGADQQGVLVGSFVLIGIVQVAFVYYLFRVHNRPWLGGPTVVDDAQTAAPEEPGRPS